MELFSASSFLFSLSSFLFPLSFFLFPLSSFLFALSSFLFPLSSFLFPLSSFFLPLSSFLFPLSSSQFLDLSRKDQSDSASRVDCRSFSVLTILTGRRPEKSSKCPKIPILVSRTVKTRKFILLYFRNETCYGNGNVYKDLFFAYLQPSVNRDYFMVGSLVRFLFTCCEESQTHSFAACAHSFVCYSSQQVNKNRTSEPTMKLFVYFINKL